MLIAGTGLEWLRIDSVACERMLWTGGRHKESSHLLVRASCGLCGLGLAVNPARVLVGENVFPDVEDGGGVTIKLCASRLAEECSQLADWHLREFRGTVDGDPVDYCLCHCAFLCWLVADESRLQEQGQVCQPVLASMPSWCAAGGRSFEGCNLQCHGTECREYSDAASTG